MVAEFPEKNPPGIVGFVAEATKAKMAKLKSKEDVLAISQRVWTIYGLADVNQRAFIDALFTALADKSLKDLLEYPD